MQKRSIVIIDHEPYRSFKRQHFFMDEFRQAGYEVRFWSLNRALAYTAGAPYLNHETAPDVWYPSNREELLRKLETLPHGTVFIAELVFRAETLYLFRALKRQRGIVLRIDYFGTLSSVFYLRKKWTARLAGLNATRLAGIGVRLLNRLFHWYDPLCEFRSGQKGANPGRKVFSVTYFDVYTNEKAGAPLIDRPYVVFLDVFITGHPDFISIHGRQKKDLLPAVAYFRKMNAAFSRIEEQTGYEVVIAAHPKAAYTDEFGHRRVLFNQTATLVKHAAFVLTHYSLASSFAVLNSKKVVLLYPEEFLDPGSFFHQIYISMKHIREELGAELICTDRPFSLQRAYPVPVDAYERFKKNYLFSDRYPLPNFQIVHEKILERLRQTDSAVQH